MLYVWIDDRRSADRIRLPLRSPLAGKGRTVKALPAYFYPQLAVFPTPED